MVKVNTDVSSDEDDVTKSDEAILFPNVKVGDVVVKPWSFGMLFDISPYLELVLDKAEKAGIMQKLELSGNFLSSTLIARIFTIASSPLLKIIALTVNLSEDEVRKLSMEDGIRIVMVVYYQNKSTISNAIKNVYSPPRKRG